MGTIGTTPPQYNQPGNLNNVPVNVTANLDASKIKQLSPAQVDAIKNLPGEKIASLNNVPINTYKNYTPQQLQNFTSNLPNANNYRKPDDKTAEAIKKRSEKQKQKAGEFEKSLDDKKGFLKDQVGQTAKSAQGVITGLLTPVLMSFVRAENIADLLIKKLTKDTKKQLQNKGTLTIENGVFTFVPNDSSNYTIFKNNFDRRVSNLKRTVSTLQNIINILNNVIKGLNIALSVIKIYIKIKQKLLLTKLARISAELAAPSPGGAKPTAGVTLFQIIRQLQQLEKDNKKVDTYQAAITAAQLFLTIFKEMLSKIQIRINQLQFNIVNDSNPTSSNNSDLQASLAGTAISVPADENYVNNNGKTYILKLVTLPNNQRQYQALDSFSKLKITQTAPSRIKTDAQLLEEIKSILG
jgi:hypothetical protein